MPNIQKLRDKIKDTGVTITALARACGVSRETLHNRLSEESEFKASEIQALTVALHLSKVERDAIFFDCDVN